MKRTFIYALVSALSATATFAQEDPHAQDNKSFFLNSLATSGLPVEQHKVLEQLVGEFDVSGKLVVMPGTELEYGSLSKGEAIFGGRFYELNVNTKDGERPKITARMTFGFDTRMQKYTLSAIDTLATSSVSAFGDYNELTRTLILEGNDRMSGRNLDYRYVYVFSDSGYVATFEYRTAPDKWQEMGRWEAKRIIKE
ncbi:MAG: DUF1579 family protein [Phycisphaerales bacterium]|jgi:hypothetical protein